MTYVDDKVCFLYREDAGYAGQDPGAAGARHRTLMDANGCDYQSTIGLF